MNHEHVLQAVTGEPWAILPEKLEAIAQFVSQRVSQGGAFSPEEIRARVGDGAPKPVARRAGGGKVAVIPVHGVMSQRMNMLSNISGGTSTEMLGQQIQEALADASVQALVLDIDSPGGRTEGVEELAAQILAARGQKPIVAVANALCASAAYWIASACDQIVATPSASVGSIGVYMVHTSYARAAANAGYDYTVIRAGRYKAEGMATEPLTAEAKSYAQQIVDDCHETFIQAVARGRNVSADRVRAGYGEGRVMLARRALSAGLVDRVATLDEVLTDLAASAKPAAKSRSPRAESPFQITGSALAGDPADELSLPLSGPSSPATEGAGVSSVPSLVLPAQKAEEIPVIETPTVTPAAGAAPTVDLQQFAELKRRDDLRLLAAAHNRDGDLASWIAAGTSVDQVKQQILAEYASGAKPVRVTAGQDRELAKPFASIGEQLGAIHKAAMNPHQADKRLFELNAAAAGLSSGIASDGGFAVQQDLMVGILEPIYETGSILSRVRRVPVGEGKNGIKFLAVDETSRVTGSRFGGLQMYWGDEGDAATASKPKFRQVELSLKKLIGLAYQTDEQLEDVPAMGSILEQAFRQELEFMLEDAVVNGDGVGKPQGIINSPSLVTQAIEGTQTIANTATFITANVAKMKSRMPARLYATSVWLANPDLEPKLITATLGGTSAAFPVYMPPGGLSASPYGTILGRPVIFTEYNLAEGTPGDLILANLGEYVTIDRNGVQTATSMHVRFLTDEQAFRITYRTDGQPLWRQAVTPAKGSNTRSPFIALAARS